MTTENERKILNESILKNIRDSVVALDFGTVTIKVQDSKIIQVEVTKRRRFHEVWRPEG